MTDSYIHYAGFGRRLVATILDTIFWVLVLIVIGAGIYALSPITNIDTFSQKSKALQEIVSYVALLSITVLFWKYRSATPGKILVGIEVVEEGSLKPISAKRGVARYLMYYISALPLFLGFIWALFSKKKQCWHDMIAKTVVVKIK
ncbi:RDD family protein [Vibrio vulnificus]|nr:RDD family protein [Vibrio vulnificus]